MTQKSKANGVGVGFQKIRRVTGYLATTARMGNTKQKEVKERVKHVK